MRQRSAFDFNVDNAWQVFAQTRKPEGRDPEKLRLMKIELQKAIEKYRKAALKDFPDYFINKKMPKDFLTERKFSNNLPNVSPRQWYSSLERMRAHQLKQAFEDSLSGLKMPQTDNNLIITDVGSRSNFFGSLMGHENKNQKWQLIDIKDYGLPARAEAKGLFQQIEPFSELPKSDIITLNSVMHHVGEDEKPLGQYDDKKISLFLKKIHNALPEDGLVVVTEDYVGKNKVEEPYNNFIKGVDSLFYPDSLGNQKPVKEWIDFFRNSGFTLEKELYPVHFNVVGFPVVESCLVFRKNNMEGN